MDDDLVLLERFPLIIEIDGGPLSTVEREYRLFLSVILTVLVCTSRDECRRENSSK